VTDAYGASRVGPAAPARTADSLARLHGDLRRLRKRLEAKAQAAIARAVAAEEERLARDTPVSPRQEEQIERAAAARREVLPPPPIPLRVHLL
jgi:hypothetical protein